MRFPLIGRPEKKTGRSLLPFTWMPTSIKTEEVLRNLDLSSYSGIPGLTDLVLDGSGPGWTSLNLNYCPDLVRICGPSIRKLPFNLSAAGSVVLTTVDLPLLTECASLYVGYCPALPRVDLPLLVKARGLGFDYCDGLAELNMPQLAESGSVTVNGCTSLQALELPLLRCGPPDFNDGGCWVSMESCSGLQTVSLPLFTVGGIGLAGCPSLVELALPSATQLSSFGAFGCESLTTISIPQLSSFIGTFDAHSCALNEATVNNILIKMAAVNGGFVYYVNVDLGGGTSAAPSGDGITARNTLIANGATVTTN